MQDDNRTLIERAQSRDRSALEELLLRNLPAVEGYLRLRMGPALRAHESSSDLVQSVCREILRDLDGFEYRGEPAFREWLFARARHKLLRRARDLHAMRRDPNRAQPIAQGSREEALLTSYRSMCTPSRDASAREQVRRIEAAFDALPEDYQEAITLHRMVGLSHAEIGERMGRTEGAVRNLVYRGLSRLALLLEEGEADEGA